MEAQTNSDSDLGVVEQGETAEADGQPVERGPGESGVDQGKLSRRRGGPRTQHGKAISRRNALKHGFFAKEAVIETEFFKEGRREFQRLLKELIDNWQPVGVAEVVQVELMATHLWQYRRLLRVQQGQILERNTPQARYPDYLIKWELRELKIEMGLIQRDSPESEPDPLDPLMDDACVRAGEKYKDRFDRFERLEEEHARIGRLKNSLPVPSDPEWMQKCEAHILRQYYRALAELERIQRMRVGDGVPPRLVVEVNN